MFVSIFVQISKDYLRSKSYFRY